MGADKTAGSLVLLLGPSGVGKSEIIMGLRSRYEGEYEYPGPYVTRPLRTGETDKYPVTEEEFDNLCASGEISVVNTLYGVRYGTPLSRILKILDAGKTALLDWPLDKVETIRHPEYSTSTIYIAPTNIVEWLERATLAERTGSDRLVAGRSELEAMFAANFEHSDIDHVVYNAAGEVEAAISEVHAIAQLLQSANP